LFSTSSPQTERVLDFVRGIVTSRFIDSMVFWGEPVYKWEVLNLQNAVYKYIADDYIFSYKTHVIINLDSTHYYYRVAMSFLYEAGRRRVLRVLFVSNTRIFKIDNDLPAHVFMDDDFHSFNFDSFRDTKGTRIMLHYPYFHKWVPGILQNTHSTIHLFEFNKPRENRRKSLNMRVSGIRTRSIQYEEQFSTNILSRFRQRRKRMRTRYGGVTRRPDVIIFLGSSGSNASGILEAAHLLIPTIGFVDTDTRGVGLSFPIPGATNDIKSLELYYFTFIEALKRSRNLFLFQELQLFSQDKRGLTYNKKYAKLQLNLHNYCLRLLTNLNYTHWLSCTRLRYSTHMFHYKLQQKVQLYRYFTDLFTGYFYDQSVFTESADSSASFKSFYLLVKRKLFPFSFYSSITLEQQLNIVMDAFLQLNSVSQSEKVQISNVYKNLLRFLISLKKMRLIRKLHAVHYNRYLKRRFVKRFSKKTIRRRWFWYYFYRPSLTAYDVLNSFKLNVFGATKKSKYNIFTLAKKFHVNYYLKSLQQRSGTKLKRREYFTPRMSKKTRSRSFLVPNFSDIKSIRLLYNLFLLTQRWVFTRRKYLARKRFALLNYLRAARYRKEGRRLYGFRLRKRERRFIPNLLRKEKTRSIKFVKGPTNGVADDIRLSYRGIYITRKPLLEKHRLQPKLNFFRSLYIKKKNYNRRTSTNRKISTRVKQALQILNLGFKKPKRRFMFNKKFKYNLNRKYKSRAIIPPRFVLTREFPKHYTVTTRNDITRLVGGKHRDVDKRYHNSFTKFRRNKPWTRRIHGDIGSTYLDKLRFRNGRRRFPVLFVPKHEDKQEKFLWLVSDFKRDWHTLRNRLSSNALMQNMAYFITKGYNTKHPGAPDNPFGSSVRRTRYGVRYRSKNRVAFSNVTFGVLLKSFLTSIPSQISTLRGYFNLRRQKLITGSLTTKYFLKAKHVASLLPDICIPVNYMFKEPKVVVGITQFPTKRKIRSQIYIDTFGRPNSAKSRYSFLAPVFRRYYRKYYNEKQRSFHEFFAFTQEFLKENDKRSLSKYGLIVSALKEFENTFYSQIKQPIDKSTLLVNTVLPANNHKNVQLLKTQFVQNSFPKMIKFFVKLCSIQDRQSKKVGQLTRQYSHKLRSMNWFDRSELTSEYNVGKFFNKVYALDQLATTGVSYRFLFLFKKRLSRFIYTSASSSFPKRQMAPVNFFLFPEVKLPFTVSDIQMFYMNNHWFSSFFCGYNFMFFYWFCIAKMYSIVRFIRRFKERGYFGRMYRNEAVKRRRNRLGYKFHHKIFGSKETFFMGAIDGLSAKPLTSAENWRIFYSTIFRKTLYHLIRPRFLREVYKHNVLGFGSVRNFHNKTRRFPKPFKRLAWRRLKRGQLVIFWKKCRNKIVRENFLKAKFS